jgi:CubicO group peptidase (beta-lactamase class C family)
VITVEQVMLHTSGFPNAPMSFLDGADAARRRAQFGQWTLEWEPGTQFEYHGTSAHWVLADIIERVSGRDFRDVLFDRVCAPLGLPRVLGVTDDAPIATLVPASETDADDFGLPFNTAEVRAAGVPGAGAIATAATMARFYQALLHNPGSLWDDAVLEDAKTKVRCTFEDPLMHVSANRSLGLVLAGDDGYHIFRYALFGDGNSPGSFGHAGAHGQVAWADPATGLSFSYLQSSVSADQFAEGVRSNRLASIASNLEV